MMKRMLPMLLAIVLLLFVAPGAHALEKEDIYNAALDELAAYVSYEREDVSLQNIHKIFKELINYKSGQCFLLYVQILMEIEKLDQPEETEMSTADLEIILPIYINAMRLDSKFINFLEEDKRFGTLDGLENYFRGRLAEHKGNMEDAYNYYRNADSFMNSIQRISEMSEELFTEQYKRAVQFMNEKNFEEAYLLFADLNSKGFNCEVLMNVAKNAWEASKPKEHQWVAATCTAPEKCSECGEIRNPALGHDFKEATCTEMAACKRCGATTGEKLEHDFVAATCEEPQTCRACGYSIGMKLAHVYSDPTCSAPATCQRCGKTNGTKLGHDYSVATCTKPATCNVCGQTSGSEIGHDFSEATCTKAATCSRCGTVSGKKLDHSYIDATCNDPAICRYCRRTNGTKLDHDYADATCTKPATCKRCGSTWGSSLGHEYSDATCTKPATCWRCGQTMGSKLSHRWLSATYTRPETCEMCGATRGSPVPTPAPVTAYLSSYEKGSRIPNSQVSASATSCEPAGKYGTYYAENANDSNPQTEWVEGAVGNGAGEKITFSFTSREINGFVIQAGMFRSSASFKRNSRPATIRIHMDGVSPITVSLDDVMKNQVVLFSKPVRTSTLTIELRTFYNEGVDQAKGLATCIADVWILQK